MGKKLAWLCVACFLVAFGAVFIGLYTIANYNDQLIKAANEKARHIIYMGILDGKRTYYDELEKKLDFQD
jgi:hypothetical protein